MTARVRRGDVVMAVVLLAMFSGAFVLSLSWPFRTALFPRLVSATGVVLTVALLTALLLRRRRAAVAADDLHRGDQDEQAQDHDAGYVFASAGRRAWGAALAWIAGFFVCLWVLGAVVTVPAFALAYLRFAGGASWRATIAYAAVAGVVVAVVFGRLLSVPMPTGVL